MTLPDCMIPDGGGGACTAYLELEAENARLRAVVAECVVIARHSQGGNEVDGIRAIIRRLGAASG